MLPVNHKVILNTRIGGQPNKVAKQINDIKNMVNKKSSKLKYKDITKIREGDEITSTPSPHSFRDPTVAVPLNEQFVKSNFVLHPQNLQEASQREKWNKIVAKRNKDVRFAVQDYIQEIKSTLASQTKGKKKGGVKLQDELAATLLNSSDLRFLDGVAQVRDEKGSPVNVFSSYSSPYAFDINEDLASLRDTIIDADYNDVDIKDAPYIGYEPNMYLPSESGHFKYFNKLSTPNFRQRSLLYDRANDHHDISLLDRTRFVGDKNITTLKFDANLARQQQIGVDTELFDLGPETRTSPIYTKLKTEDRLPRPPLPVDTQTSLSPTVGLLHVYRLHHAHMYFAEQKKLKKIHSIIQSAYEDLDKINLKLAPIQGVEDVKPYEKFLVQVREELKMGKFGFGYKDKSSILKIVKELIPRYAAVKEQVVEVRRRRKK